MQGYILTSILRFLWIVGLCSVLLLALHLKFSSYWTLIGYPDPAAMNFKSRDLPSRLAVENNLSRPPEPAAEVAKNVISLSGKGGTECIERNICKDPNSNSEIYFYNRTNFDELVELPVNYNKSVLNPYPVVPRTVHFCLFNTSTFRFHYMISVMAASRFVQPDKIFVWHNIPPSGRYWEETLRKVKNMYLIHRDIPTQIRGQTVKVIEHVADIVRIEALLEYGGMYFDTDSVVVNTIDPLLVYDVTMGHAVSWVLANGILFSKPWSDFFKIWHREYRTFNDNNWGGHSVIKPYQLSKTYPNLIHVEPKSLCRPNWKELPYLFGRKRWDFQHNNFVVHLYMRFGPKKDMNAENILTWNTTAGSIMRYIYYGNGHLQTTISRKRRIQTFDRNKKIIH